MTLQAELTLTRAFLAPVSTPTSGISCGTAGSVGGGGTRSDTYTQEGSFRPYANGVTRLILGTATSRIQAIVLRALTPAQVSAVQAMVGKTCLFRDTYGRRLFGSFIVTANTDIPLSGVANADLQTDVSISFQTVSYIEGV